jgi:RNA polymerase sigma-32 factor
VLAYLRVVPAIARGYRGYGLPQEDLIQEGNIGLMKAVRRFDPERKVRLVSFAIHWIKAEIHEFILRNYRLVRIATTKPQRKLFFKLRSLKDTLGSLSPPEVARIAKVLGVNSKDVAEMEVRLAGGDLSLEPGEDDEEGCRPLAYLSDSSPEPSLELETAQQEQLTSRRLGSALEALDSRSRRIIETRWLREQRRATLHELADELDVSPERVRQIEARALNRMKEMLLPWQRMNGYAGKGC